MKRVFIQKKNGEFINVNAYNAYFGFEQMGFEIHFYEGNPPIGLNKSDIVVGWIGSVQKALKNLGIDAPTEIDYPQELNAYWGRKIWKSTLESVRPEEFPIFIKPIAGKQFDGRLVKTFSDLIGTKSSLTSTTPIWKSEPVHFLTEWRVFVRYNQILDARKYKGDPFQKLDKNIVEQAIKDFSSQPAAFSIDFGITDDKRILCIEINDGYSLGSYGLFPTQYAKLLCARWCELTGEYDDLSIL